MSLGVCTHGLVKLTEQQREAKLIIVLSLFVNINKAIFTTGVQF